MQSGYVAVFVLTPTPGLSCFRYLALKAVTLPRRYFAPNILPPGALLARWRLALISLAPRAACSDWERYDREKKRGALTSSAVLAFRFFFWRIVDQNDGQNNSSHVWRGLFFLLERRLLSLTDRCGEIQVVSLFCPTRASATSVVECLLTLHLWWG